MSFSFVENSTTVSVLLLSYSLVCSDLAGGSLYFASLQRILRMTPSTDLPSPRVRYFPSARAAQDDADLMID